MGNCQIDFGDSRDNQQLLSHPVQLLDQTEGRQEKTGASAGQHTDHGLHLRHNMNMLIIHFYHEM
jgi:hypothetical protein